MSRRLTREEIRLAARFVFELLELQRRKAPDIEIENWRSRVERAFPPVEWREGFSVTIGEVMQAKGRDLAGLLGVMA